MVPLLPGKSHGRRSLKGCIHGIEKSWTRLSNFTFTFHFHALAKEMATHSSVLAWRIPGTGEPGGLPSSGSHRVRHDLSDLAAAAAVPVWPPTTGTANSFIHEKALTRLNCLDVHFSSLVFFSFKIYIIIHSPYLYPNCDILKKKISLVFSPSKPYRYLYFDRTVSDGSSSEKIDGCRHE